VERLSIVDRLPAERLFQRRTPDRIIPAESSRGNLSLADTVHGQPGSGRAPFDGALRPYRDGASSESR